MALNILLLIYTLVLSYFVVYHASEGVIVTSHQNCQEGRPPHMVPHGPDEECTVQKFKGKAPHLIKEIDYNHCHRIQVSGSTHQDSRDGTYVMSEGECADKVVWKQVTAPLNNTLYFHDDHWYISATPCDDTGGIMYEGGGEVATPDRLTGIWKECTHGRFHNSEVQVQCIDGASADKVWLHGSQLQRCKEGPYIKMTDSKCNNMDVYKQDNGGHYLYLSLNGYYMVGKNKCGENAGIVADDFQTSEPLQTGDIYREFNGKTFQKSDHLEVIKGDPKVCSHIVVDGAAQHGNYQGVYRVGTELCGGKNIWINKDHDDNIYIHYNADTGEWLVTPQSCSGDAVFKGPDYKNQWMSPDKVEYYWKECNKGRCNDNEKLSVSCKTDNNPFHGPIVYACIGGGGLLLVIVLITGGCIMCRRRRAQSGRLPAFIRFANDFHDPTAIEKSS